MNKFQYFIFWLKWKNRLNDPIFDCYKSIEIYSISPSSFKISWNNYKKLK